MAELDKSFLDIVVSKDYKVYSETKIHIDGKDYLVKIPVENVRAYITARNKIRYKVEHTSPPRKRGRKKIYATDDERRQAYIERRKNGLLNPSFGKSRVIKAVA